MYEDLLDSMIRDVESKTNDDASIVVATLFNRITRCFETAVLVSDLALARHVPDMLREVADNIHITAVVPPLFTIHNVADNPVNIDGIISLCRTGK